MEGPSLVRAILSAHRTGRPFASFDGVTIEPQTGYRGLVAITAYNGWRYSSHRNRPQVGLFDLKVILQGRGIEHVRTVIVPTVQSVQPEIAEAVFRGEDPRDIGRRLEEKRGLATLQAAMAEQDVNWGNEVFQCKTYFAPPDRRTYDRRVVSSRPRDLLMGYIRRCYALRGRRRWSVKVEEEVLEYLDRHRQHKASRSAALMPQMKGRYVHPEWERFHEDPSGTAEPWLWGELLEEYRSFANTAPDNPKYRGPTGP